MYKFTVLAFVAVIGLCLMTMSVPKVQAQVSVGVNIGAAPDCPYGYYDYAPYACAPYGYYGPEWFTDGVFIGAGPWFHGGDHFRGHVDNHFDVHHGYKGPLPKAGERAEAGRPAGHVEGFKGNEMRDGHGHTVK